MSPYLKTDGTTLKLVDSKKRKTLKELVIPTEITEIGKEALRGCTNLTSVYIKAETPPSLGEYVFSYKPSPSSYEPLDCKIYVPNNSVEAYKTAHRWER